MLELFRGSFAFFQTETLFIEIFMWLFLCCIYCIPLSVPGTTG